MALQELMSCAGMRTLKSDIGDDMASVLVFTESKGPINETGLCVLNYNLGRKAGLEMVLNRLANYEDDLIGVDVKIPKK